MSAPPGFPAPLRWALLLYRLLWFAGLPVALGYLWWRGRRDPEYARHWAERFGGGAVPAGAVWVHAVSLGETRSAFPLIQALLARGETVVTTHLTPAGRRAAEAAFAAERAAGRVSVRYLPVEQGWAWRRLLRRARAKLILSLEIEIWPVMIAEAARAGVPLWLANSQVPERSLPRAMRVARWLGHPVAGVAGVLAKSDRQADRFRALGARNVHVTGELRFDQQVPEAHLDAAAALTDAAGFRRRGVVTLASVVAGEDRTYLGAIEAVQREAARDGLAPPMFVYVPRAPERFAQTGDWLEQAGQRVIRRSQALDDALAPQVDPQALSGADILLGDSMGEMYFYLALADAVVIGGGYVPKGAHNVIEPLSLQKPVLVGPHVWTIEYPGREAQADGALEICDTQAQLAQRLSALLRDRVTLDGRRDRARAFLQAHAGATARSLQVLEPVLDGGGGDAG